MTQEDPGDHLLQLIALVRAHLLLVFVCAAIGAIAGVAASFLVVPQFRGEVVAVPADDDRGGGSLAGLAAQVGGLAALAGVDVGAGRNDDEVLAHLRSRQLGEAFIRSKGIQEALLARRTVTFLPPREAPVREDLRMAEAYRIFDRDVRTVGNDKKAGVVRVTFDWSDAPTSADWANSYVAFANAALRERALAQSREKLEYLAAALRDTKEIEVREAVGRIVEGQLRMQTLAKTRAEFALKVVDPAKPSLYVDRLSPRRGGYGIAGLLFGVVLALVLAAVRRASRDAPAQ